MKYIRVDFPDGIQGYQESCRGEVTRYTDLVGNTIIHNESCVVIDAEPPQPAWALTDTIQFVPKPASNVITKLEYMNRFTDTELATIYTLAKTMVQIEIWLEKFKMAENIDLVDPRIIAGLNALETAGALSVGRASEILNA